MIDKKIIAISGFIGSGKDTAAQFLIDHHGFTKLSFADTLKDAVSCIFGWERHLLEGTTIESREWREQIDQWWSSKLGIPNFTPRFALQHLGTNVLRDQFNDNIWILSLEKKIVALDKSVVISDCRFPNEAEALKSMGGKIIGIRRGAEPEWVNVAKHDFDNFLKHYPHIHPSEYNCVKIMCDHQIENSGDLSNLYTNLESCVFGKVNL